MTSTGFVMANRQDISTLFEPYSGGTKSALTGYKVSNGTDLNTVFDPHTGTDASATGFFVVDGVGVVKDLNKVFAKIKSWKGWSVSNPFFGKITKILDMYVDSSYICVCGSRESHSYNTRDGIGYYIYNIQNNTVSQPGTGLWCNTSNPPSVDYKYLNLSGIAIYNGDVYILENTPNGASAMGSGTSTFLQSRTCIAKYSSGTTFTQYAYTQGSAQHVTAWHFKSPNEIYISANSGLNDRSIFFAKITAEGVCTPVIAYNYYWYGRGRAIFALTSQIIYMGGYIDNGSAGVMLIKSTDGGANWTDITGYIYNYNIYFPGTVQAIWGTDPSNIYIGGKFTSAFGVNANYIVKYDGSNFININGANGPSNIVTSIHSENNTNIYVTQITLNTSNYTNHTAVLMKYSSSGWTTLINNIPVNINVQGYIEYDPPRCIVKVVNGNIYIIGGSTYYVVSPTSYTVNPTAGLIYYG